MDPLTRREFSVALMSGVPAIAAAAAAQSPAAVKEPEPPEAKPPREPTQAERLVEVAARAHPDERLDGAARAEIRGDVEQFLSRAAALATVPLTNGDEPGFAFGAFRKDG